MAYVHCKVCQGREHIDGTSKTQLVEVMGYCSGCANPNLKSKIKADGEVVRPERRLNEPLHERGSSNSDNQVGRRMREVQ